MKNEKNITLKTLTKSGVWDLQENDVFRLWEAAEKDNDLKDNQRRYLDIIRSAFEIEPVKIDRTDRRQEREVCHQEASYHACD